MSHMRTKKIEISDRVFSMMHSTSSHFRAEISLPPPLPLVSREHVSIPRKFPPIYINLIIDQTHRNDIKCTRLGNAVTMVCHYYIVSRLRE